MSMAALFADRSSAGKALAEALQGEVGDDALVLGLPRGGVPVAVEVARVLGVELDVLVARKLGAPGQPEFGVGAIAPGGVRVLDERTVRTLGLSMAEIESIEAAEFAELERRLERYRGSRPWPRIQGRTVVVVDDGVATGGTARAALRSVRAQQPRRLIFAAPVGPVDARERLSGEADDVILLETPEPFQAVGLWYERFDQTQDDEVVEILAKAREAPSGTRDVQVPVGRVDVDATLSVPDSAIGLVIFAHGSGSSRFSPRNRYVARVLQDRGLATLLLDLLTPEEEHVDLETREHRFDIPLLADRVVEAISWARSEPRLRSVPIGLFGSSTGGAAALVAAACAKDEVGAVVSRGGRPDLATSSLPEVRAPTLLLVGGRDNVVIGLNEDAKAKMRGRVDLRLIPDAGHLFEEPGSLEEVAGLAADFFAKELAGKGTSRPAEREAH